MTSVEDHAERATSPQLTMEVAQLADRTVISLSGEVDLCTSRLVRTLRDAPVPGGAEVAIAASAVHFIDLSGWRVLREVVEGLRRRGHPTSIVDASPQVARLARLLDAGEDAPSPETEVLGGERCAMTDR